MFDSLTLQRGANSCAFQWSRSNAARLSEPWALTDGWSNRTDGALHQEQSIQGGRRTTLVGWWWRLACTLAPSRDPDPVYKKTEEFGLSELCCDATSHLLGCSCRPMIYAIMQKTQHSC